MVRIFVANKVLECLAGTPIAPGARPWISREVSSGSSTSTQILKWIDVTCVRAKGPSKTAQKQVMSCGLFYVFSIGRCAPLLCALALAPLQSDGGKIT